MNHQPPYGPPAHPAGGPAAARRRVAPHVIVIIVIAALVVAMGAAVAVVLATRGGDTPSAAPATRSPAPRVSAPVRSAAPAPRQTDPAALPTASTRPGAGGSLQERDAFMRAQDQPNPSTPTPRTAQQKAFIKAQSDHVTKTTGKTVTPTAESFWLASTLNACETAILNGHDTSQETFNTFVATSPLFASVLKGKTDPTSEKNVTSTMIFGMRYICPQDAPQWEAAWRAKYGG